MKKGKVKRLISEIGKTVQALELEDRVYAERHRRGVDLRACRADVCVIAADNQAPHLSEIYAGFANITRRAKLFGLRSLEPVDKIYGHDLQTKKELADCFAKHVARKPLVTVIGIMCTVNSTIQHLNYYWRPEELEERRKDFEIHVKAVYDLCCDLLDAGLHVLIENPKDSKLWQHPLMIKLRDKFHLFFVVGHMCAYGLVGEALPILKPTGWLTDDALLAQAVSLKCTGDHDHEECLGKNARRGQVYSEELADWILYATVEIAKRDGDMRYACGRPLPHKFCWVADCLDSTWAAAGPPAESVSEVYYLDLVRDTADWVPILDAAVAKLKGKANASMDVKSGTPLFEQVRLLVPWTITKVQLAREPKARRMPLGLSSNTTHRGLVYRLAGAGRSIHVESEPLDAIGQVAGRFPQAVEVAVFVFGQAPATGIDAADHVAEAPAAASPPTAASRSTPTASPSAGAAASQPPKDHWADDAEARPWEPGAKDITFPGAPDAVVPPWVKATLRRLHTNLGHPANASLVSQLARAGASGQALMGARCLRCAVCLATRPPRQPKPGALLRARRFLDRLLMDILYVNDVTGTTFAFLNLVDDATVFQVLVRLPSRHEDDLMEALLSGWLRPFGPPDEILTDQESGFKGNRFTEMLAQMGTVVRFVPRGAHWQMGKVESHGQAARWIMDRLVKQFAPSTPREMDLLAVMTTGGKNSTIRRAGSSPAQWAFGRNPKLPAGLLSDPEGAEAHTEFAMSADLRLIEAVRAEAMTQVINYESHQGLRAAMLRKGRPWRGPFQAGQRVAYWREGVIDTKSTGLSRRVELPGYHKGTIMSIEEGPNGNIWLRSDRGRVTCVAREQLRALEGEEAWSPNPDDISARCTSRCAWGTRTSRTPAAVVPVRRLISPRMLTLMSQCRPSTAGSSQSHRRRLPLPLRRHRLPAHRLRKLLGPE